MKVIVLRESKKISKAKKFLEKKLNVKLELKGKNLFVEGNELEEYTASRVLEAAGKGFDIDIALLLRDENYIFEVVNIKNISPRRNLSQVRARVIGKKGRTLKVLSELSDCHIILRDNNVYIIGPAEKIKQALNGLRKLIRGSKQSSTYSYLERQRKNLFPDDLGLKTSKSQNSKSFDDYQSLKTLKSLDFDSFGIENSDSARNSKEFRHDQKSKKISDIKKYDV